MEGYIYHLRNDAMPGLAKLGFSGNISNRMQSLCTTGIPMMFDCIFAKKVKNMRQAEIFLFIDLAQYRFNPNREFFKVSNNIIKESFDKIEGKYIDISSLNKNYIRESIKNEKNNIIDNINNTIEFMCKRCNNTFTTKSRLKTHLQRKTKCVCINPKFDIDINILIEELCIRKLNDKTFDCDFCGLKFNHASGKSQHKKICKEKPIDEIIILKNTVDELYIKVKELEKKQHI